MVFFDFFIDFICFLVITSCDIKIGVMIVIGSASGVKIKLFETKSILKLEEEVNDFLLKCENKPITILDIRYQSDKEEYGKQYTAMVVFRKEQ
jgi:hypothetical protein